MPLVSIIIPVYNAEKTIKYCLDSIFKQTIQDYEIIAVDDGSADQSLQLLYQKQESIGKDCLKIFAQLNAGAGMARNLGLSKATGKYVTFIDSDDFVEMDYLKRLLFGIEGYDICVSGYQKVDEEFKVLYVKKPKLTFWSAFKYSSSCGKLYHREIISKNNIIFEDYRIGEDLMFLTKILSVTNKVNIISYSGYCYMLNKASVTNTISKSQKVNQMTPLLQRIIEILKTDDKDLRELTYHFIFKTAVYNLYSQRKIITLSQMNEEFFENIEVIKQYHQIRLFWQKGKDFVVNLLITLFLICYKLKLTSMLFTTLRLF